MVANLLHLSGLYLGEEAELIPPDPTNPLGHWESLRFVEINNQILRSLGGRWYLPPSVSEGWTMSEELTHLRERAELLVKEFCGHEHWGWKDPRSSLTLPFWTGLLPELKVVICLRNPLEVVLSLRRRPVFKYSGGNIVWKNLKEVRAMFSSTRRRFFSTRACLRLWQTYNEQILESTTSENRIITHYEAYFHEPYSELCRVLEFLGMSVSPEVVRKSSTTAMLNLRHNHFSTQDLQDGAVPEDIIRLYVRMSEEAKFDYGITRRKIQTVSFG